MASQLKELSYGSVEIYIDDILGTGAYGKVCRAKCGQLPCAAKLLHDILFQDNDPGTHNLTMKFLQECRFLISIKHPNIVQCLGTIRDPESRRPVLLMELMDESLTKFLERSTTFVPYHIQVNICYDVALALAYLHSNDIIHRDLSSNNVLLIGSGSRAKVTDFGMSKFVDMSLQKTKLTQCPGTDVYMPPEALIKGIGYSNKLDCFSFGVLCIQIMTRNFPNPGEAGGYVEDPKYPNGRVLIQYCEVDRRKKDIDLIKSGHPLLPMALNCLKDKDVDRPLANELCEQLATLKSEPEYLHVMEQTENGTPQVHMEKNEDSTGMQEAEYKPEFEGEIKALQEKMEKTVNEYKQEMKRKANEYQQKLKQKTEELQQEHQKELQHKTEEHQKELEQKIEEHQQELKRKNIEHERELARNETELKAKFHHEIQIIEEKHRRELDELKKKMDTEVPHPSESVVSKGAGNTEVYYPKKWNGEAVRILITGKTGSGKSALINGIVGADVAEEGGGGAYEMKEFNLTRNEVKIVIRCAPGLQDTVAVQEEYPKKMQRAGCGNADLVLYCTRMDDSRLRHDDIEAIKKLTVAFGKQMWRHALFILTFANRVEKNIKRPKKGQPKKSEEEIQQIQRDYFKQRIKEWKEDFGESLREAGVSSENIIVVPAGYGYGEVGGLPDREDWLSPLFYACLTRMKPDAQAGLFKAQADRIKQPEDLNDLSEWPSVMNYGEPQAQGCNIS